MKRLTILLVAALLFGCSSSDNDQPNYPPRGRAPMGDGGNYTGARPAAGGGLDMLPPAGWWRQPTIVDALRLTGDQMTALDKISNDQSDEIARLERDSTVAVRDLRNVLDSNQPASTDITGAGQRIRALRDSLFDRQVQMLAAERQVLTQQQWQALQQQLQERRSQRNEGYPRRGGRGVGGRGRWPGY